MATKKEEAQKPRWMEKVGSWAFIIGVVIAVILGAMKGTAVGLLLILGTIVGLLNVTNKEVIPFLIASIALIVAGLVQVGLPIWLTGILSNVVVFVVPAAIIGSLKTIYVLASTK